MFVEIFLAMSMFGIISSMFSKVIPGLGCGVFASNLLAMIEILT